MRLFFFHGWAQAPREKTRTCPREAILAGASDDVHFGDLFITENVRLGSSRRLILIAVASRQCPRSLAQRITKNVRLGFITAAEVDRRHFTTVSTFAGAANFERTDISNRPNFVHEPCRSVHPRVCGRKWLHQLDWEFARTVCLSCCHLRIDVQRASAVAFLFLTSVGGGRGRCMDMPMCMRTFRVPASSDCAKFCVARVRRIMFPARSGQNLSTRSQRTRPQSLENVLP